MRSMLFCGSNRSLARLHRMVSWALLWGASFSISAQQGSEALPVGGSSPAQGAGRSGTAGTIPAKKKSVPAPVKDSLGHIAIYPPAEVVERDQVGQLLDFSARAELLNKVSRMRDRAWERLGLRRVRPPESVPIQILRRLDTPEGGEEVSVFDTGYARAIRMRVAESEDGDSESFVRAVLVAVVRDVMARQTDRDEAINWAQRPAPRWLVDALLHCEKRPEVVQVSDELNALSEKDLFSFSLADLLARPEDDPKRSSEAEILAARCFLSLLGSEGGRNEAFQGWLRADPVRVPVAALGQYFPWLPKTAVEIQKAWTVHGAALRSQRMRVSMTAVETEKALERLLEMDVVLPGNVRQVTVLDSFEEFIRIPGIESVLRARRLELIALAAKGHFMFEPLIRVYADLCLELVARRTKNLSDRFRSARAEWESVRARLEQIRGYLDWWEKLQERPDFSEKLREMYQDLDAAGVLPANPPGDLAPVESRMKERDRPVDRTRFEENGVVPPGPQPRR